MTRGEKIALHALEKEMKILERRTIKAKQESDEASDIPSELVAINEDFYTIANSKEKATVQVRKLDALVKRREKAQKIMRKDICKLFEKQLNAETDQRALADYIALLKFRFNRY